MKPKHGGVGPQKHAPGTRPTVRTTYEAPRVQPRHRKAELRAGTAAPRRGPAPKRPPVKPAALSPKPNAPTKQATDWSEVADWYDKLVGDEGSEYHQKVIFPGVLRMLGPKAGDAFLDVASGQGALCRLIAGKGAAVQGIDAAEPLVAAARGRGPEQIKYHVGDVRELQNMPSVASGHFTSAACILAIQNIHPIAPVFAGVARVLRPMGQFLIVMMHPCFRGPKESSWGWDGDVQYRRVDRYLIPRKSPIVTHPGSDPDGYTWTFHKPLEAFARAGRGAGLLIDAIEEWPSHKTSQPGPRAAAENRAREEIPMFMAMRFVKILDHNRS